MGSHISYLSHQYIKINNLFTNTLPSLTHTLSRKLNHLSVLTTNPIVHHSPLPSRFPLSITPLSSLYMATIHHHSATSGLDRRPRRHSLDYSSLPSSSSFSLSKHLTTTTSTTTCTVLSLTSHPTFSISATSTTTTTATAPETSQDTTAFSIEALERHLAAQNFRQADEVTRRLLIILAGEAAVKRGYVFFSEAQFIPMEDLKAIDNLWLKYSDGKFGYSVQKKIWRKVNKDFTKFFIKVGWMKKLDTEVEQFNYRSFPNEFMWELNPSQEEKDDNNTRDISKGVPPQGHLPLTNALRGTQLLNCIFTHPAFAAADDDDEGNVKKESNQVVVEPEKNKSGLAALRDRFFKPNYSF